MKKVYRAPLAAALVLGVMFLLLACGGGYQTTDANALVTKANANIDKYNSLAVEVQNDMKAVEALPNDTAGFAQKSAALAKIQTKITAQKTEVTQGKESLTQAKALNISDDYKTYLGLLIDSWTKRDQVSTLETSLVTTLTKIVDQAAAGTLTAASGDALLKELNDTGAAITTAEDTANKAQAKAQQFFKDKNLGK
jgi:hypothetical protein